MNQTTYTFLTRALGEDKMENLELAVFESTFKCIDKLKEVDPKMRAFLEADPKLQETTRSVCRNNYIDNLFAKISDEVADHQFSAEEAKEFYRDFILPTETDLGKVFERQARQLYFLKDKKILDFFEQAPAS